MDCSRARTRDPVLWLRQCPAFSRPLAEEIHEWILNWEPDLNESIKWNLLCFSGRKLILGLSACQHHLGVTFFRGTELPDPAQLLIPAENNTRILGLRITELETFPKVAFRHLVHAAVTLDESPQLMPTPNRPRQPWPMPDFFAEALARPENHEAATGFQRLAPSCQREYLVWLTHAKRPETRARRLAETLAAVAHGKKWDQRHQTTTPPPLKPSTRRMAPGRKRGS